MTYHLVNLIRPVSNKSQVCRIYSETTALDANYVTVLTRFDKLFGVTMRSRILLLLIIARKRSLGQGNIFTPFCTFLHLFYTCLPQCMLGYHPPGADTPPRTRHPPGSRRPGVDTPREQSMLGATVNERAVRILLKFDLVQSCNHLHRHNVSLFIDTTNNASYN